MITTRNLKCVSCAADLGEMEGKLDRYKPWAIFPGGKQTPTRGYSSIKQHSSKKDLQEETALKFDNPDVRRTVSRNSKATRPSTSETNFMRGFGRRDQPLQVRQEYQRMRAR
jgi:hypothetical protein